VKPQFIGWHAELLAGDKLLVSEQSSDDDRIAEAVEELKAKPPPPTPARPILILPSTHAR
jgi:hypothetical protein